MHNEHIILYLNNITIRVSKWLRKAMWNMLQMNHNRMHARISRINWAIPEISNLNWQITRMEHSKYIAIFATSTVCQPYQNYGHVLKGSRRNAISVWDDTTTFGSFAFICMNHCYLSSSTCQAAFGHNWCVSICFVCRQSKWRKSISAVHHSMVVMFVNHSANISFKIAHWRNWIWVIAGNFDIVSPFPTDIYITIGYAHGILNRIKHCSQHWISRYALAAWWPLLLRIVNQIEFVALQIEWWGWCHNCQSFD